MPVYISMLRGVNVGGHNLIKMDTLRALYASLELEEAQTYVQSGNVIFRAKKSDETALAKSIQTAIEKQFGFRPEVILRTLTEMRAIVAASPFAKRKDIEPGKLVVSFLLTDLSADARKKLADLTAIPEEIHPHGRELYIYFPDGQGKSKLGPVLDRTLKVPATARNWNSVTKLLAMAEALEA